MRKLYIFGLIALPALIIGLAWAQEQITLTTYYPAPYGVYKQLKLNPTDDFDPALPYADEGAMYYDASDSQAYICDGSGWQPLGGGGFGQWRTDPPGPDPLYVQGTSYQATSNGFVCAYDTSNIVGDIIQGYSDNNVFVSPPPPAFEKIRSGVSGNGAAMGGITMPVRNGDYWMVTGPAAPGETVIRWLPLQ